MIFESLLPENKPLVASMPHLFHMFRASSFPSRNSEQNSVRFRQLFGRIPVLGKWFSTRGHKGNKQ
jgi:hypothetical protein